MVTTESLTATAIDRLVSQHLAAWNATDPVARRRHLEATWGDDGVYQDPGVTLCGRDALHAHIGQRCDCHPQARLVVVGAVRHHHRSVQFSWALVAPDGRRLLRGDDFATLGPDDRLQRLVVYFNASCDAAATCTARCGRDC